jgi:hypothetical protein
MKTKQIVQSSVNVIKITNLKKGDVFKIVDTIYGSPDVNYGVVIDLLNSGHSTYVEVLQYRKNYGEMDCKIKLLKGDENVDIFPCEISEVEEYLKEAVEYNEKSIKEMREKLQKKIDANERAKDFISGELSKKLTKVSYEEISQIEFDKSK